MNKRELKIIISIEKYIFNYFSYYFDRNYRIWTHIYITKNGSFGKNLTRVTMFKVSIFAMKLQKYVHSRGETYTQNYTLALNSAWMPKMWEGGETAKDFDDLHYHYHNFKCFKNVFVITFLQIMQVWKSGWHANWCFEIWIERHPCFSKNSNTLLISRENISLYPT